MKFITLLIIGISLFSCSEKSNDNIDITGTWFFFDKHAGYTEIQFTDDSRVGWCTYDGVFMSFMFTYEINQNSFQINRPNDSTIVENGELLFLSTDSMIISFKFSPDEDKREVKTFYKLKNNNSILKLNEIRNTTESELFLDAFYQRRDSIVKVIETKNNKNHL